MIPVNIYSRPELEYKCFYVFVIHITTEHTCDKVTLTEYSNTSRSLSNWQESANKTYFIKFKYLYAKNQNLWLHFLVPSKYVLFRSSISIEILLFSASTVLSSPFKCSKHESKFIDKHLIHQKIIGVYMCV